jgi:type II secretory pathway component GspD/PulD (secretin)
MKKILIVFTALLLSTVGFAKAKSPSKDLKFIKTVEAAFEKPLITGDPSLLNGKNFLYESYAQKKTVKAKRNFISHYLKLNDVNLTEAEEGILAMKSRDSVKNSMPVYKNQVPNNIREQMITVVISLPKGKKANKIDKSLRALYSKDGDMKITPDNRKIIVSDWASNVRKIVSVIEQL